MDPYNYNGQVPAQSPYFPAGMNVTPQSAVGYSVPEAFPVAEPYYGAEKDTEVDMVSEGGEVEEDGGRPQHKRNSDGLVMLLGYAIGIGNLWRFPYLVGKNGGGAFLIPYLLFLVTIASPAYLLEMTLGQKFQKGAYMTYKALHPAGAGLGLAMCCVGVFVTAYYNVLLVWSFKFLFDSFQSTLPWTTHPDGSSGHFYGDVLQLPDSISDAGGWSIPGHNLGYAMLLYTVIFLALAWGIHAASKVAYVTVGAPILILVILFFRVIFLEGAGAGIAFYLTPSLAPLLDIETWASALGQILFSLSPGLGTALAIASYNPKKTNVFKNNIVVSCVNSSFSLFGGFVVFSMVGHMAHKQGKTVEEVAAGGPGLTFVTLAEAVTYLPFAQLWSVCLYLMLLMLGMDSVFALLEACKTIVCDMLDAKKIKIPGPIITYMIVMTVFCMGLPFATRSGLYYLDIVDRWAGTYGLLLCVCMELTFVGTVYGFNTIVNDLKEMTGVDLRKNNLHFYYYFSWTITPFVTFFLFCWMCFKNLNYGNYPAWALGIGWVSLVIPMLFVVIWFLRYPSVFRVMVLGVPQIYSR